MSDVRSGKASLDDLTDTLSREFRDISNPDSNFRETCRYFFDEVCQLPEGLYLVSPQTGKVIRALAPGDIETPDVLRGDEGSDERYLVKGMPRLKPEIESRLIVAAHIVEKDSKIQDDLIKRFGVNDELSADLMMLTHLGRAKILSSLTPDLIQEAWLNHNPEGFLPLKGDCGSGIKQEVSLYVPTVSSSNGNPKYSYLTSLILRGKNLVYSEVVTILSSLGLPKISCTEHLLPSLDVASKGLLGDPDVGSFLSKVPSIYTISGRSYLVSEGASIGVKILETSWKQGHNVYSLAIKAEVTLDPSNFIELESPDLAVSGQVL
jgi:hypothetical protein